MIVTEIVFVEEKRSDSISAQKGLYIDKGLSAVSHKKRCFFKVLRFRPTPIGQVPWSYHWNNNYSILYIYFTFITTRRVITTLFQLISSIQKVKLPNIIYFTRQLLSPRYISLVKDWKVSTQKNPSFRLSLAFGKLISFLLSFSYFFFLHNVYTLVNLALRSPTTIKIIPLNSKNIFLSATRNGMTAYNQFAC